MSTQAWEQHHHAAQYHELAAYHHSQAAKHDEAGDYERAAQHAYLATGYFQNAIQYGEEAEKLHADHYSDNTSAPDQDVTNKCTS